MAAVILGKIQAAEVEEFKSSEQVKKSQHPDCPSTKRALSVKEDLYPAIPGLQPPGKCFADSRKIVKDRLQECEKGRATKTNCIPWEATYLDKRSPVTRLRSPGITSRNGAY